LLLDAFERVVRAFGFDDAAGFAVEVEDIVGAAGASSFFANCGRPGRNGISCRSDIPSCSGQLRIDD